MKYVLSFGAGLNSAALLVYLIRNKLPLDLVVFADTQGEHPYTYEDIKHYKQYCETNNVPFIECTKGSLETYCLEKKLIPSISKKWCTDKFKRRVIRKTIRDYFNFKKTQKPWFGIYLGIMYDEIERMHTSDVQYAVNLFPFAEGKFERRHCKRIIKIEHLPVPRKSGCWFCPWQTHKKWELLKKTYPFLYERQILLEKNCSNEKVRSQAERMRLGMYKPKKKMQCTSAGYCGV